MYGYDDDIPVYDLLREHDIRVADTATLKRFATRLAYHHHRYVAEQPSREGWFHEELRYFAWKDSHYRKHTWQERIMRLRVLHVPLLVLELAARSVDTSIIPGFDEFVGGLHQHYGWHIDWLADSESSSAAY